MLEDHIIRIREALKTKLKNNEITKKEYNLKIKNLILEKR